MNYFTKSFLFFYKIKYFSIQCLKIFDTPTEVDDMWEIEHKAKGSVLIAGLGLGVAVELCARKKEVKHITVIEISGDVLQLVANYLDKKYPNKIEFINGDIFKWNNPSKQRYDVAFFDIWDNICSDNLKDFTKLRKKFTKFCDWMGFWCAGVLLNVEDQDNFIRNL